MTPGEIEYIQSEGARGTPPGAPTATFPERIPRPAVPNGPAVGHCPTFPSTMKFLSATTAELAPGASETLTFTTPGAFCPMKMIVIGTVDTQDLSITSVQSGLDEQIISGVAPGGLFSMENNCCPVACLKCLCQPGVSLTVTVRNDDAAAQTATVVLVGSYLDMCPPNGIGGMLPDVPGCPVPGTDRIVGFELDIGAGATEQVEITTPGRFCPRVLFLHAPASIDEIVVTGIESGLKDQIISGAIPASVFSIDNECCLLACFDCLCMPGYPLSLTFTNTGLAANTVRGALVGSYTDYCP